MLPLAAVLLGPREPTAALRRFRRLAPVSIVVLPLVRWELALLAVVIAAAAVTLVACAAYGPISRWVEYRLISWAIPLLALVVAAGAVALPGLRGQLSAPPEANRKADGPPE